MKHISQPNQFKKLEKQQQQQQQQQQLSVDVK